ncbi:DUF3592 domain-containing protein [Pseudozobellia thermophila]|uniref:DUF3592 domain-containing protein n=1 Tax=Pseudozobellia thermophila TaxID=192903 RepID=A0A1M6NRX6_9FLAO|nr:DUF3592 domain-containing protein [Pseudozobellia thermophila]SHJ98435.1 Protein of unknown function [Pseudozobellia thermophila]
MNFDHWNYSITATLFILVLTPLALYFGYWLLITGTIGALKMLQSKKWQPVIGKIIAAEIRFNTYSNDSSISTNFRFVLKKTYTYRFKGRVFTSDQTLASDYLYDKEFKTLERFPKKYGDYKEFPEYMALEKMSASVIGRPVTVYVNPNHPASACLENRFEKEIFLPIFMGAILSFWATYFLFTLVGSLMR